MRISLLMQTLDNYEKPYQEYFDNQILYRIY